jgi:phosphoglycolate phosphatase-like HAD superfamily hydrolase
MRLFLFDIDGTLITASGAGRVALGQALAAVYGTAGPIEEYDLRGKTDPQIVFDLMRAAGIGEGVIRGLLPTFFDAYPRFLERVVADGHRIHLMPGVEEVVRGLSVRQDCLVGLLTGNIEPGARIKLRPTGLLPLFLVGAFGSDHADRRRLPIIARQRAQALTGQDIPFEQITVIGDTPLDIDCARACGTRAVAVATGHHPTDELAACGPDLVFPDFSDSQAVLLALTLK